MPQQGKSLEIFSTMTMHNIQFFCFLWLLQLLLLCDQGKHPVSQYICCYLNCFQHRVNCILFIGHITKLYTLSMFPLVLMILLKFQNKIKLLDVILLTIASSLLLSGWHVQVIFYTYFAIGIYFLYFFIRFLIKKETGHIYQLLKSLGVLIAATIIGFQLLVICIPRYMNILLIQHAAKKVLERKKRERQQTNESALLRLCNRVVIFTG